MKQLILVIAVLIFSACSKNNSNTTTKLKLFGANTFSAGGSLATRASNGLMLYGTSNDGKTFTQAINSDSIDLVFPNGVWNFYAVSWENTNPASAFQGNTYCGKSLGNNLSGSDASINLTLTSSNCLDADFSSSSSTVGGVPVLPYKHFYTCRNISGINTYSSTCSRASDPGLNNRGYATYIKLLIPQYTNFGNGPTPTAPPIASACIEIDSNAIDGGTTTALQNAATILDSSLSLPDGKNGLHYAIRTYFTANACDDTRGYIDVPLTNTLSTPPAVSLKSATHDYFETKENLICQAPRLDTTVDFAGGRGTAYSPYVICNTSQFNQIDTKFTTYNNSSFELGADLDFGFGAINTVGNTIAGDLTTASLVYNGALFEGNLHRIQNVFIDTPSTSGNIGLFRNVGSTVFQNLTLNRVAVIAGGSNYVGSLIGLTNAANLSGVKFFGHVEGSAMVGGIVGYVAATTAINNTHSFATIKGVASGTAGGIVGIGFLTGNSTISNSSFKGRVTSANDSVGSIIGYVSIPASTNLTITNSSGRITGYGALNIGGIIGTDFGAGTVNLTNVYAIGSLTSTSSTKVGGIIGSATATGGTTVTNSIALIQKITSTASTTYGGIYGDPASTITCAGSNFYFNDSNNTTATLCNTATNQYNTQIALQNAAQSAFASNVNWTAVNAGDLPRLAIETFLAPTVPYLGNTACDGNNNALTGAGTLLSPYLICNSNQFTQITPGNTYVIKHSLFFNTTIPQFPAGHYVILGNGHAIYGLNYLFSAIPTHNEGLFNDLDSSSVIQDLTFVANSGSLTGQIDTTNLTGNYFGFLAGTNAGTISNITFERSTVTFGGITGAGTIGIGGIVGANSGIIQNITDGVDVTSAGTGINATGQVTWGGIAALNKGSISVVKINGQLNISHQNITYSGTHKYGGIVSDNLGTGTISEITHQGAINISGSSSSMSFSKMSPLIVSNLGALNDTEFVAPISNVNSLSSGVIYDNSVGTMNRVIFSPTTVSNFPILFPSAGVNESFCVMASTNNCFSTLSYTFSPPLFTASGTPYSGTAFGALPSSSSNWNMTTNLLPNTTNTWQFTSAATQPRLMRTGGSMDEIGSGF